MKAKLYHGKLGNAEITETYYDSHKDLVNWARSQSLLDFTDEGKTVYLCTVDMYNHSPQFYIGQSIVYAMKMVPPVADLIDNEKALLEVHLHEYASYESALAVARDMAEVSPLCYD